MYITFLVDLKDNRVLAPAFVRSREKINLIYLFLFYLYHNYVV